MDSVLMVDQDLVTDAVRTLALNTLSAYRSGVSVKWHDAELAIYLVYIFGEINKSKISMPYTLYHPDRQIGGGKGRAAFCQAPVVAKESGRRRTIPSTRSPITEICSWHSSSPNFKVSNRAVSCSFSKLLLGMVIFSKYERMYHATLELC